MVWYQNLWIRKIMPSAEVCEQTSNKIELRNIQNLPPEYELPLNKFSINKAPLSSFKSSVELGFLLGCLEATMAKFGWRVNELQLDILQCKARCLVQEWLPESHNTLLWPYAATLYQEIIIFDNTIVWETSHWGNVLLGPIDTHMVVNYSLRGKSRK